MQLRLCIGYYDVIYKIGGCHATNHKKDLTRKKVWLNLVQPTLYRTVCYLTVPPRHTFHTDQDGQSNFTMIEGEGIVLPCGVEGDPRPTIAWYKDESPISLTDYHYFIREDGSLEIFSADPQDTGAYRCTASNVAGEIDKSVNLYVQGKHELKKCHHDFPDSLTMTIFVYYNL